MLYRQWCWNYFNQNAARIRYERDKAFAILDSKWDDTRAFAFIQLFKTQFTDTDWDADTLIAITDSVRKDVKNSGRIDYSIFQPDNALEFLTKLSEHPSTAIQMCVSS